MEFFKDINTDTVVLTPNRRLSATLHKLYQQYQLQQNQKSWPTPKILPINIWINQLWKDYSQKNHSYPPLLLNTAQEQSVWEKIILSSKDNEQLIQISETADLARAAWGLLRQWEVSIEHPLFASSQDYLALQQWVRKYEEICREKNWIDAASLPEIIIKNVDKIKFPSLIMTYGFTEFSPLYNRLLGLAGKRSSQAASVRSSSLSAAEISSQALYKKIGLSDAEHEIQTIACWAKSLHEKDAKASIGCVIPSLDKIRDRVQQIFTEVFEAETPFNITAGKSLSTYPIINTALQILSLHKNILSIEAFSHLLTTPFIAYAETERIKRAAFDAKLKKNNKNVIHLDKIHETLAKNCPQFAMRLNKLTYDSKQELHSYWANQFSEILLTLGWPGERSLNSEEYQIVETWLNLLGEFASLDYVAGQVSFQQALYTLKKMAGNMQFQPRSPDAPIQVLGMLEAAGMPFDHLWVAGLDDISWPPQPRPNPFIPKRLQRELQMPHATAEREFVFCNTLTQQFMQNSGQVIFSHAEKLDELELQPSPLIRGLPCITFNDLKLKEYINPARKIFASKEIEWMRDETGPQVGRDEKIGGGVSVIKQQALCPFKAYSEWRLHAKAMENPQPGMRAKDRGTITHKALELIWNQLQDQTNLVSLSEAELDELIFHSIDTALNSAANSHAEFPKYISLEKQRLHGLIRGWLKVEKSRPPFRLITNETSTQCVIGPLSLSVRIDRIDQLQDGSKLIIDYKTGKQNEINCWFGERPEEPQLPIYALLDPENISGITFAQIHAVEHCFKGVSHYDVEIRGVKEISQVKKQNSLSWNEQIDEWRKILSKLSNDFHDGLAKVDPKDLIETCKWCALQPLCRINEKLNDE